MVDMRLESIYDGQLPPDCYVSVRVGETQKLSRLIDVRTYRFPTCPRQRLGKIEVYKRVGACSFDADPSSGDAREVRVSCGGGIGTLGLRVHLDVDEATRHKTQQEAAAKKGTKMRQAQDYLAQHALESVLSEAMFNVLRDRPDDPLDFIIGQLSERRRPKAERPPPEAKPHFAAAHTVPAAKTGEAAYYSQNVLPSAGADTWNSLYELFPPANRPAPAQGKSGAEHPAMPGEAAYYSQTVLPSAGADTWKSLYELFPQASRPAPERGIKGDENSAKPGEAAFYSQNVLPSADADTWNSLYELFPHANRPALAPGKKGARHTAKPGEAAYYKRHVLPAVSPEPWSALYEGFPQASKAAGSATPALPKTSPSVGTWLAHRRGLPGPICAVVPRLSPAPPPGAAVAAAAAADPLGYYSVHRITEFNRAKWEALEYVAPV